MNTKTYISQPYGIGQFWIFNNGQFGEKKEIVQQDHYEILIDNTTGKELGLYCWKSNNTGNSHFEGSLTPISSLCGKQLEAYMILKNQKE